MKTSFWEILGAPCVSLRMLLCRLRLSKDASSCRLASPLGAPYGQLCDYPASLMKQIGTWIPPSESMKTSFWEIPDAPCVSLRTFLCGLRLPKDASSHRPTFPLGRSLWETVLQ
ncbi:unnamed protein product [Prunus armeniaca]